MKQRTKSLIKRKYNEKIKLIKFMYFFIQSVQLKK
jgi:hypothetical protein